MFFEYKKDIERGYGHEKHVVTWLAILDSGAYMGVGRAMKLGWNRVVLRTIMNGMEGCH